MITRNVRDIMKNNLKYEDNADNQVTDDDMFMYLVCSRVPPTVSITQCRSSQPQRETRGCDVIKKRIRVRNLLDVLIILITKRIVIVIVIVILILILRWLPGFRSTVGDRADIFTWIQRLLRSLFMEESEERVEKRISTGGWNYCGTNILKQKR